MDSQILPQSTYDNACRCLIQRLCKHPFLMDSAIEPLGNNVRQLQLSVCPTAPFKTANLGLTFVVALVVTFTVGDGALLNSLRGAVNLGP